MVLYCYYDKIAKEYSLPFGAKNHGCAIRFYKQQVKNGMNPDEISLYAVAEFDQEKGFFHKINNLDEIDVNARSDIFEETEDNKNG